MQFLSLDFQNCMLLWLSRQSSSLVMSRSPVRIGSVAPCQTAVNRHFLELRECLLILTKYKLCAICALLRQKDIERYDKIYKVKGTIHIWIVPFLLYNFLYGLLFCLLLRSFIVRYKHILQNISGCFIGFCYAVQIFVGCGYIAMSKTFLHLFQIYTSI